MTIRRSIALLAAALTLVIADNAQAQMRRGMGGVEERTPFRFYGLVGWAPLEVDELNERLASLDEPYSPVGEDLVTFGFGLHARRDRLILGGEALLGISTEKAEVADQRRADLSTFQAAAMAGFSILQSDGFDLYPLLQAGFAGASLHVRERGAPAWDDVLADPGRSSNLTTGTFYGAAGVGMEYVTRSGFMMGVRGTWGYTPPMDGWREEEGEVLGGPEVDLSGPSVRLMVGWGGRGN